ncbi:PQQ-dependent sugar dehydrogenase [Stenotrophomonas rhizophila]|uniref:PQQ-dependent sugar dehydrogenase n=1 Tax=Stenotrophomonas rhizophila TaxID=216778 RepID=A0A7V7YF44_9GAMM|nr:PQQ-dependent sugar dehydrogenase [Stenotrophomonas rhizophila]KAB7629783.1 PQQ-dependent sugar dehydrogenase [Stenotrophomonas rhizophila]
MRSWLRTVSITLAASLATAAVASLMQTQINLHALTQLGLEVSWQARAAVTVEDLARFGPVMVGFSLAGGVLALGLQAGLRRLGLSALPCALLASLVGLAIVLALLRSVIPMPAIAAIREMPGLAVLSLCGLVGGYVSHTLTARAVRGPRLHRGLAYLLSACLVLLPLASFLLMHPKPERSQPPAASGYQATIVADGLQWPWSLAELPDGRLLVTEMAGQLKVIDRAGDRVGVNLSKIPAGYQQERVIGLMDIALSPDFEKDHRIYLTQGYRDPRGVGVRLIRSALNFAGGEWSIDQVEILFESTPKPSDGNNGGRLAFLDTHTLLMTVGDGSARREEAQNQSNSLGKVMRISLAPSANGAAIYTSGHRNPQGIVRDPFTGAVYVSEHGPRGGDELNRLRPGGNYGWPLVSHGIDYPFARVSPFTHHQGFEDPEVIWSPSIAPSGLAVYQGALFQGWQGDFLVPALRERSVRRLVRDGDRVVRQELLLGELGERIRDVKVAGDGSIYALTDGVDGKLLRMVPRDPLSTPLK